MENLACTRVILEYIRNGFIIDKFDNFMKLHFGSEKVIVDDYSRIVGSSCTVTGNYNLIIGSECVVRGDYNLIRGTNVCVNGDYNTIIGSDSIVKGNFNKINGVCSESIVKLPEDGLDREYDDVLDGKEIGACKVCLVNKIVCVNIPCMHAVACISCAKQLKTNECIVCRSKVKEIKRFFI